jgi:hypothetical protein
MKDLINLGSQFIGFRDEAATLRGKTALFLTYFQLLPSHCLSFDKDFLSSNLFPSEALRHAEERADALEAKLKSSEIARKKLKRMPLLSRVSAKDSRLPKKMLLLSRVSTKDSRLLKIL